MVGNILLFCQLFIVLYSFYINFKNSAYMKRSNWYNSIICYVSLGMISNNIDNVSTKAILTLIMFLILWFSYSHDFKITLFYYLNEYLIYKIFYVKFS